MNLITGHIATQIYVPRFTWWEKKVYGWRTVVCKKGDMFLKPSTFILPSATVSRGYLSFRHTS
jgi:hypothetical protein